MIGQWLQFPGHNPARFGTMIKYSCLILQDLVWQICSGKQDRCRRRSSFFLWHGCQNKVDCNESHNNSRAHSNILQQRNNHASNSTMMHPSPFDEALSRDFLNESYPSTPRGGGSSPVKNKWFYTSFGLSSSSSTTLPLSDDEEDSLQSSDGAIQIETVEFEAAVLQERHESITEINQSLQQIHLIQQGKKL